MRNCEECGQPIYPEQGDDICDDCARENDAIENAISARLEAWENGG